MTMDVVMPKLGVEMTQARVSAWLRREGDWVRRGDAILTIETDKVTYDVKAEGDGFLHIVAAEDAELPVGALLGRLAETRDAQATPPSADNLRATPLARKLARTHGVELTALKGTGPGGRIREADVLRAVEECGATGAAAGTDADPAEASPRRAARRAPFKGIRRVIAKHLCEGLQTMAQMTDLGEMDVTELVRLREQLNREPKLAGSTIGYTDLFVKALGLILREMPAFNASLEGEELVEWAEINVAVAVAIEGGLLVPVVRNADAKPLAAIHAEVERLVGRARAGDLALGDVSGATFTLSNFGSYGSYMGTPLINPPQVAVLGTGQIVQKPVVQDGAVVVRWMMGYGLTIDHRVLDGADAGRFMARLRELCERPAVLLLP